MQSDGILLRRRCWSGGMTWVAKLSRKRFARRLEDLSIFVQRVPTLLKILSDFPQKVDKTF
jgi:hypothetical protein